jgi:hypothetical protein
MEKGTVKKGRRDKEVRKGKSNGRNKGEVEKRKGRRQRKRNKEER